MTPVTLALKDSDSRNATKSNDHLADALNEEASRWLADFLTIAVGRRECYGSTSASHPYGGPRRRERPWSSNGQLVQTLDLEVFLRDGQKCSVSGSTHSLVCVQLIPTSEDTDRLSRFRRLARAFFDNDLPCIEDPVLRSTENAMLVTCFWKDRLDSGFLTFNSIDKELHATPMSMSDSDLLDEERRLNGVQGPTLLQLCGGVCQYPKPVNQELAKVHHTIIGVLRETGLLGRLMSQIEYIRSIPPSFLSLTILSPDDFARVLKHKLRLL
ncbi:hypothetical protein PIIN_07490 [Serendipita indica DSM 11827]|uniref:Uncharacterized protein n=1 Tax=Serendipita indica (strain DSM 11827) TaxID=1109443 RepID=G4TQF0_SERID|nr:hypothetical protein PIIN_07490 [Serendipita indica DSM 11827]